VLLLLLSFVLQTCAGALPGDYGIYAPADKTFDKGLPITVSFNVTVNKDVTTNATYVTFTWPGDLSFVGVAETPSGEMHI
jgi:hypothetical protein